MYKYHKTYHKSSHICECENRSLLPKGRRRGQKSVLTELDWPSPRQSSETAAARPGSSWVASAAPFAVLLTSLVSTRGRRRVTGRPGVVRACKRRVPPPPACTVSRARTLWFRQGPL